MNTKILEYIVAIAEERSVTRAAERFYLSHPALSRHLRAVEDELGKSLFHRTPGGMELTPAGLYFISDARAILHLEQQMNLKLEAMRQERHHSIRIIMDTVFYNRFVQRVVPAFAKLHPEYTLDITKGNAAEARDALRRGDAVLAAFISGEQQVSDLTYLPFLPSRLMLVFPRAYSGTTDIDGLRQALEDGMFLSQYPSGSTVHTLIEQRLSAYQIYPKRVMEGETRTIMEHMSRGNTCCMLPEFFLQLARQAGLVIGSEFCPMNHVLAYSSQSILSPVVKDLMQEIIKAFSSF